MKCLICQEKIVIKRTLWNLFQDDYFQICNNCFIKYPVNSKLKVYPIENYLIYHIDLNVNNIIEPLAYQNFIGPILVKIKKLNKDVIVIYQDEFTFELYKLLDNLRLGNIYLLTLKENTDNKGEEL